MKNSDESLLVEGIKSGEEYAFEWVFNQFYIRLCLFAQKYVSDSQTSEEIVCRVIERLWEKRESLHITQNLSSYLFQSVYNESLNYLNSFSQRQKPTDSIYLYVNNKNYDSSFLQRLYAKELEEKIKQGIHDLPDRCSYIFYMSRYENLSHKEIAEKLDISIRTVESHIAIALEKLRELLQSEE